MTDDGSRKIKVLTLITFVGMSIFATLDVITDYQEGIGFRHLAHEIGLSILSLIGAIYQFKVILKQRTSIAHFSMKVDELTREKEEFKKKVSNFAGEFMGLITEQFNKWGLTPGERDVGLLLIKGLSMKEIADLRNSNEATVRQQASAIYKKSGVGGRQELAAFFLDDLLIYPMNEDKK